MQTHEPCTYNEIHNQTIICLFILVKIVKNSLLESIHHYYSTSKSSKPFNIRFYSVEARFMFHITFTFAKPLSTRNVLSKNIL